MQHLSTKIEDRAEQRESTCWFLREGRINGGFLELGDPSSTHGLAGESEADVRHIAATAKRRCE